MVFSSIYPVATDDYPELVDAIDKLKLNDASLTYQKRLIPRPWARDSAAVFLGLLHLEVVQERLERGVRPESDPHRAQRALYHPHERRRGRGDRKPCPVSRPGLHRLFAKSPMCGPRSSCPERYIGAVMQLCLERRGEGNTMNYPTPGPGWRIVSELPLAEIIYDFYDQAQDGDPGLRLIRFRTPELPPFDLVKLDSLSTAKRSTPCPCWCTATTPDPEALHAVNKLKDSIPRQQFKIAIQGAIGGTIIARSTINAFRKDVTAKCYGGDVSRKRKLLEKQKAGKKNRYEVGGQCAHTPKGLFGGIAK